MIDAVWTVGHHPSLCGTEKWSHALAKRLGVPVRSAWSEPQFPQDEHPLISVRASEVRKWGYPSFDFDLFLHDWYSWDGGAAFWLREAKRVYAANPVIAREIREHRPDVIEAFAPSTIDGNPTRGAINVLTFGMAHKLSAHRARYEKLKGLLDDTPVDYTVSVSTAIHEGSPWDETAKVADELRGIFGTHLRVLGYLADDALARELVECTAVAIFFDPALRANNTTFWAAIQSGAPVITNVDEDSPIVRPRTWNIDTLTAFPTPGRYAPVTLTHGPGSWGGLLDLLQGQPCAK